MNNVERGEYMFNNAGVHFEHMLHAYRGEHWNIVVREAQEVVELSLKGLLKLMCIEYPRVHDVAPVVVAELKNKGIRVNENDLDTIKRISRDLSRERAPAFYGEKVYTKKQAEEAKKEAEWMVQMIKELRKELEREG